MRKFAVLLLLLFVLALLPGCGARAPKEEKTAGTAQEFADPSAEAPAGLSGELERLTDHMWRLTLRAEEGETWRYGEEYTLLRGSEAGYLPVTPEKALPRADHRLFGGQEKTISVNLAYAYGELPAGDYLLQKRFLSLDTHPEETETEWGQLPPEHLRLLNVPFSLPETLPAVSRPSDPWDYLFYRGETLRTEAVTVRGEGFTSAGGALVMENRGDRGAIYGYDWSLFFREGKEWLPVPLLERPGSGLLGATLEPGEEVRQELSFEAFCGLLPPGSYRLVQPKDVREGIGYQFDFTLDEDGRDASTFPEGSPS